MTSYELLEGFPFRQVTDPSRVIHLNNVARGLLEMFCLCMETGESTVVLTWPSRVENIAILHALAELQQIVMETEGELRPELFPFCTYFWPWKQTSDIVQKRLLVDRTEFVKGNLRFFANFMDKQHGVDCALHMAFNRIKDLDPEATVTRTRGHRSILPNHPELTHPTLFEITPQAVLQMGGSVMPPPIAENFLNKAQKYLGTCSSLSDSRLFQIDSAPFFMLGIPGACERRDLCRGGLSAARRPNIVLVDLTGVYSRIGKNWQSLLTTDMALERVISSGIGRKKDVEKVVARRRTNFHLYGRIA